MGGAADRGTGRDRLAAGAHPGAVARLGRIGASQPVRDRRPHIVRHVLGRRRVLIGTAASMCARWRLSDDESLSAAPRSELSARSLVATALANAQSVVPSGPYGTAA